MSKALLLVAVGFAHAATLITLDGSGTTNPSKVYWEVMVRAIRVGI